VQLTLDMAAEPVQVLEYGSTKSLYGVGRLTFDAQFVATDRLGTPLQRQQAGPFGFAGELTDASTGLVYLRSRWYDPTAGRFLGRDLDEGDQFDPRTLHPYAYAHNNPVSLVDPSGQSAAGAMPPFGPGLIPPGGPFGPMSPFGIPAEYSIPGSLAWLDGAAKGYRGKYVMPFLLEADKAFDKASALRRVAEAQYPIASRQWREFLRREAAATARGNRALSRATANKKPWLKSAGKWAGRASGAIDGGFAAVERYQHDREHGESVYTAGRHAAIEGGVVTGFSIGGGAVAGSACAATGIGVIVSGVCAAGGSFVGGVVGREVAPLVNDVVDGAGEIAEDIGGAIGGLFD